MPRTARFKIAAIQELLRQLEYAPAETRRRQMDAAEALIADLDPHQNYPEDFIIFRITGYRPDRAEEPVTLVGQALLPDLVNLVQTLSESLDVKSDGDRSPALTIEEATTRLQISRKSIQRYRKQGLVCHYIVFADGVKRLGCFNDALEQFVNAHALKLKKAGGFTRINGDIEADIIRQARELRAAQRLTLNQAARRLALQCGRAHETIRQMLRRHDRKAADPIFHERGPLTDREITLIHRAWQWGIEASELAERYDKSKPTIHRAANRRRRDLLRTLKLSFIDLPTFALPDADEVILAAPAVIGELNVQVPHDALALIDAARRSPPPMDALQHALAAGYNLLKHRAAESIIALGEWPRSEQLDRIETDLRWASLLRRRLVMIGLPAAIARIEQNLHRPLREQSREEIIALVELAIKVLAKAVESLDPSRGQQLQRIIGLAMDKALAKIALPQALIRAAAKHDSGAVLLGDPLEKLCPWDSWLNLRRDLRPHVAHLPGGLCNTVERRFGLHGGPPLTVHALAKSINCTPVQTARILQQAIRELRALHRAAHKR